MGQRYTGEETDQIRTLTEEGLSSREIADRLGRPEAGIRNLRHRMKLKTTTKKTISSLKRARLRMIFYNDSEGMIDLYG